MWIGSEAQEQGGQEVMVVFHGMDWALRHVLKIIMMIFGVLFHSIDEESGGPKCYNWLKALQLGLSNQCSSPGPRDARALALDCYIQV